MNRVAQFDVLVVGGGPAGMAAAATAGECGAGVGVVDDNFAPGGQIWRGESQTDGTESKMWADRLQAAKVELHSGTRIFHQPETGVLLGESSDDVCEFRYSKLIIATGARERFLPFPGWTLPNVMGAGGLQALVKSGLPISGKRVVVAGTGPLLLAVAAYLRQRGAEIPVICEQASRSRLASFAASLLGQPGKFAQALQLRSQLRNVPLATNSWVVEARGKERLEEVTLLRDGRTETVACGYLACGFHLAPNIELAVLLGCTVAGGCVQVDDRQQTSLAGVFCAGEPTGIGGVELAVAEGRIAGFASAGREVPKHLLGERTRSRRFARRLNAAFALRPELRGLPQPQTIVCRCEDVSFGALRPHENWRQAKLHTRCGMGPCQGRVCGPAAEFLFGWKLDSVRPPIFPVAFSTLAGASGAPEPLKLAGGRP